MHLYLQGLLSHLPRKNAEAIAAWVDVERQVIQDFIGTAAWDHRRLVDVLVKWLSGWASPMASSPLIPAASPNAARTPWGSNASGVATGARSTPARWAFSWG